MLKQYILTEKEAQEFEKSAETNKCLKDLLDLANLRIALLEKENSDLKNLCFSRANRIKSLVGALSEANRDLIGTTMNYQDKLDMARSQIKSLRGIIRSLKDESLNQ